MIHKIQAVIIRDFKECMLNMGHLTSILLPVIMGFMFMRMEVSVGSDIPTVMFYIVLGVTFASAMATVGMSLLAEENEHGTMDRFIRTRRDLTANLIGKSILLSIISAVVILLNIILFNQAGMLNIKTITGLLLLGAFFLFISLGFGMIIKTLAGTSVYILIILFIFAMGPYVEYLFSSTVQSVFAYSPLYQNIQIHQGHFLRPVLTLSVWVAAALIFFLASFHQKAKSL